MSIAIDTANMFSNSTLPWQLWFVYSASFLGRAQLFNDELRTPASTDRDYKCMRQKYARCATLELGNQTIEYYL